MQKYIIALLFSIIAIHAVAQDIPLMEAVSDTWRYQELKNGRSFIAPKAIQGNPYLDKDFKKGKLFSKVNLKFPEVLLRYNVYTDKIEYKAPDGTIYALKDQNKVTAYQIDGKTFVYSPYYEKKNKVEAGYFQVLTSGKATALVRYKVYLIPASPEKPYTPAKPEHFSEISKTFYVKTGEGPARMVTGTKSFLRLFPQQKKQLSRFIKNEKIHIQKVEDFVKLVDYYNTLVTKQK